MMSYEEEEAARHLLWEYKYEGGIQPGSFSEALIRAMEKADPINLEKLLTAFPEYRPGVEILSIEGGTQLSLYVRGGETPLWVEEGRTTTQNQ